MQLLLRMAVRAAVASGAGVRGVREQFIGSIVAIVPAADGDADTKVTPNGHELFKTIDAAIDEVATQAGRPAQMKNALKFGRMLHATALAPQSQAAENGGSRPNVERSEESIDQKVGDVKENDGDQQQSAAALMASGWRHKRGTLFGGLHLGP